MAKKATTKNDILKQLMAQSKKVDKELDAYSSTLDNNCFGNIEEYIDTGSYMLNRLITGSIYNGIPRGRVVGFAGEPGVGKSYVCGRAIANAQKAGYTVMLYDSETAISNDFLARIGCVTEEILYFPIDGIEQFRNHFCNTVKPVMTDNPDEKILVVLDSYGNLSCAKEIADLESNKTNTDMGCFVPDTLIKVNDGVSKIQDIKEGDIVITHLNRERKVTKLFRYENKNEKIKFTTKNGIIEVTPEHKLFVYDYKTNEYIFKQAKTIDHIHNTLVSHLLGKTEKDISLYEKVQIDSIETVEDEREVYDLEVEDDHTYLLANNIISHNSRAKAGKSMFKEVTKVCGRFKIPMLYTNHVYRDTASAPNPMYAVNKQAGGQQPTYMSSAVIFLSKRAEKDADKKVTGNVLTAKSNKNRLAPEGKAVEMYLSFQTGPNRYYGLIDMGLESGLILPGSNTKNFIVPHIKDTQIHVSKIYGSMKKEVFNDEILQKIDEYCRNNYTYNSVGGDDFLEETEEE